LSSCLLEKEKAGTKSLGNKHITMTSQHKREEIFRPGGEEGLETKSDVRSTSQEKKTTTIKGIHKEAKDTLPRITEKSGKKSMLKKRELGESSRTIRLSKED